MRSAYFSLLLVLGCPALHAQINPRTQILWPSGCSAAGMVYSWQLNQCINMNAIDPGSQVLWPSSCTAGMVYDVPAKQCIKNINQIDPGSQVLWPSSCTAGMVYDVPAKQCIRNINQIDPNSQITWPAGCNAVGMVYNQVTNSCIPATGPPGPQGPPGTPGAPPFFYQPGIFLMGDSWMAGAVIASQGLGNRICAHITGLCTNLAVAGSWAADEAWNQLWPNVQQTYTYSPAVVIEAGINDAYNAGAAGEQNYQYTLQGMVAQAAIPALNKKWGAACTPTGTTAPFTAIAGIQGSQSSTNGSGWTCIVGAGTKVDVAWWAKDANGGTASVNIDSGAVTDTLNAYGFGGTNIQAATTSQTIFAKEYTVPQATSHVVTITVTSATGTGNNFALIFAATPYVSTTTPAPPKVYVYGVPFQNLDANSAITAGYNTIAQNVATAFSNDGLAVYFVPIRNFINSTTDMSTARTNLWGYSVSDAVTTAASTAVTSATANFGPSAVPPSCSAQNMGPCWPITITGAGSSGGDYSGVIVGYTSATQITVSPATATAVSAGAMNWGPQGSITCGTNVAPLHANCAGIKHAVDAFNSVALPGAMQPGSYPQFSGIMSIRGAGSGLYFGSQPGANSYAALLNLGCDTTPAPTFNPNGTIIGVNVCGGNSPNVFEMHYNGGPALWSMFRDGTVTTNSGYMFTGLNGSNGAINITPASGLGTTKIIQVIDTGMAASACYANGAILCANVAASSNQRLYDFYDNSVSEAWVDRQGNAFFNATVNAKTGYQINGTAVGTIASGTFTTPTTAISAGSCGSAVVIGPATGVVSTDTITRAFNAQPGAGWAFLTLQMWPSSGTINYQICNPSAGSVTPAAVTINWRVIR